MPLDGAMVATPPAGTTAVPNTVVASAPYNALKDDIYNIFNTKVQPLAGGGSGSATAIGAFDAFNTKGADIATAATVNLDTATGAFDDLTGTTTVTAVTLAAGKHRMTRAAGDFQITVGALLIGNAGGANIAVKTGDLIIWEGYAGGVVRFWVIPVSGQALVAVDGRVRAATTGNITIATALNSGDVIDGVTLADGDLVLVKNQTAPAENGVYTVSATPARSSNFAAWASFLGAFVTVAEGTVNAVTSWQSATPKAGTLGTTAITFRAQGEVWEPIERRTFSASASQSFTDLSPYVMWRITGYVIPATNAVTIRLRTSSNNGSSYNAGASDYTFQYDRGTSATADAGSASSDSALISPFTVGNTAGYMSVIGTTAFAFNKAQAGFLLTTGGGIDGTGGRGVGDVLNTVNLTAARDAFQIFASAGNISGFIFLEGVRG